MGSGKYLKRLTGNLDVSLSGMCGEGPDRFLAEMDRSILREVIQRGRDQGGKDNWQNTIRTAWSEWPGSMRLPGHGIPHAAVSGDGVP